jgi:hybrid cluster-associated redox disulfide protein
MLDASITLLKGQGDLNDMVVNKNTRINEILNAYPEAMKFFNEKQMSCGSCFAVKFDTLENGALMHGMEVTTLIGQLEQFLQVLPNRVSSTQHK